MTELISVLVSIAAICISVVSIKRSIRLEREIQARIEFYESEIAELEEIYNRTGE